MLARTQIGGKYDQSDLSLFSLKRRLTDAGVEVTYPASEGIVCTIDGRGYTFDPRITSFFDVETDYYRSIAGSDFHTVNNRFLSKLGRIGASAALEMTYAMLHERPIVLMHQPELAASVDPVCADVITQHQGLLHVHDMAVMDNSEIAAVVNTLKGERVDYNMPEHIGRMVMAQVDQLFQDIKGFGGQNGSSGG